MEIIRQALTQRGFSQSVATRASQSVRQSSGYIYNSNWKNFAEYCLSEGKQPLEVDMVFVAQFFDYLFSVKELSVSTIKGYRSALNKIFSHTNGLDISNDPTIQNLFRNFNIERPFQSRELPKWDLTLVLNHLKGPPYEPLLSADLPHVAPKTAFLLLLASAARRGEIHALEYHTIAKGQDNAFWWIKPNPRFVAKNYNPATGKGMFKGIKIRSVKYLNSKTQNMVEESLCPIRSLRWYLHMASRKRGGIKQLFITCNRRGVASPIHKNTLTSWIKKIILDAYNAQSDQMKSAIHRACHEIRAVASSFALFGNSLMEHVMQQCRWAQPETFAKYYLRRVTVEDQGLMALLPLEMAGSAVTSQ
jgi:integrase